MTFVSIIIPIYNEEKYINNCIDSILIQDYPKNSMEVLLVDGGSSDKTQSIITGYSLKYNFIKLYSNPYRFVPYAMNIGIKNSSGDFIIRLDAHSYYPVNYITELIKNAIRYETDNIGTVCLTEVKKETAKSSSIKFVLSNKYGVGNSLFRVGVSSPIEVDTVPFGCFTRSIIEKVGGYDERLIRNQDIEINKRIKRLGGRILLLPEPKCIYFARESYKSFAKNNFLNGKWNILTSYYTKDINSLSIRHYIPLLFFISIILPLMLSIINSEFIILSLFIVGIYLVFMVFVSINKFKLSVKTIYAIFSFILLHFSYGMGSFMGLFDIFLDKFNFKKI